MENTIRQQFLMSLVKVELERQVVDFIRSLPPEPRGLSGVASRTWKEKRATSGRSKVIWRDFIGYGCCGIGSSFSIESQANGGSSGAYMPLPGVSSTRSLLSA